MEALARADWLKVRTSQRCFCSVSYNDKLIVLANAFIKESVSNSSDPFKVVWYKSNTTVSIQYLKARLVNVGIICPVAKDIAINQGIAVELSYCAFRDYFLVAEPPFNPVNLTNSDDVPTILLTLHEAAEAATSTPLVRFLT